MTRIVNDDTLALIKQWEGLKLTSYQDGKGVWTIGYGHTSAAGGLRVSSHQTITKSQADSLFVSDLAKFENRVSKYVTASLTDNQFGALVSFDYNTGAIDSASFVKALNAGDYSAVPIGLMKYVNSGGKKVQGLVNRRSAEVGLWAKGNFVHGNDVPQDAKAPLMSYVTKENITYGAGILGGFGSAFTSGPMAYAAAGVLGVVALVGIYLFVKSRS